MIDPERGHQRLFIRPEMARDLLKGCVHLAWAARLDFSTLDRVSSVLVGDELRERADGIPWKGGVSG